MPSFKWPSQGSSGSSGVSSLNSLTGALTLVEGSGITITPSGSNITIGATGGGSGTVTSVSVVSTNGFAGTVATATTTPAITLSTSISGLLQGSSGALTAYVGGSLVEATSSVLTITGGANSQIGTGTSIQVKQASTSQSGYLSSTDWNTFNGKQASGSYITALTGDGTASGPGSVALTLATVNTTTGPFGSSTSIPSFTVNGKGLITAASTNVVIAPAGTLSGTTLNSTVVSSSLTSVGTITSGSWTGTAIATAHGGTGQTSVIIAPTASTYAGWDANKNLSANNILDGFTTTATAVGTTTLVVGSTFQQVFTGSTTQIVKLPTTSIVAGTQYLIINLSTGSVTVESSGANSIQVMAGNTQALLTALVATPTTAANWSCTYQQLSPAIISGLTTNGIIYATSGTAIASTAAGAAGRALVGNGTGSAPTFQSGLGASYTLSANTSFSSLSPIIMDTLIFDTNTAYGVSTGKFTCPVTGLYMVSTTSITTSGATNFYIVHNTTPLNYMTSMNGSGFTSGVTLVSCTAGDTLQINSEQSITLFGGAGGAGANSTTCNFSLVR